MLIMEIKSVSGAEVAIPSDSGQVSTTKVNNLEVKQLIDVVSQSLLIQGRFQQQGGL